MGGSIHPPRRVNKILSTYLEGEEILNYLASVVDSDEYEGAVRTMDQHPGLTDLVRTPLFLHAFAGAISRRRPTGVSPEATIETPAALPQLGSAKDDEIALSDFMALRAVDIDAADDAVGTTAVLSEVEEAEATADPQPEREADEPAAAPSLARILSLMIERMLQHDSKHFLVPKDGLSLSEPLRRLRHLAAAIDGKTPFSSERAEAIVPAANLQRFLSLGLLEREGELLDYSSRVLQAYLAADHLWFLWRDWRREEIPKFFTAQLAFWEAVLEFFRELAHEPAAVKFIEKALQDQFAT